MTHPRRWLALACVAPALWGLPGCGPGQAPAPPPGAPERAPVEREVAAFCGDCHAVPPPASFPRRLWREQVELGFRLYVESGRTDLAAPAMHDVIRYYELRAPEELVLPTPEETTADPALPFRRVVLPFPHAGPLFPGVSHVHWTRPGRDRPPQLLFCDMCTGEVRELLVDQPALETRLLGRAANPDHVEPCDLAGDGSKGYVVADLGSFPPGDHQRGKVLWFHDGPAPAEPIVLCEGLGRVADVQPVDFRGDHKLDLLVAEFGWRTTGRLLLLEQVGRTPTAPQFRPRVLDDRHGIIHTPVVDLDRDGRLDFVALFSQEFESIEAFLNRGQGWFERRLICAGPDPSFGSSGIQVVDLDGDGDSDVLYTNGDTLDGFCVKPEHAVHWLENRGAFPFEDHVLTTLPGVMRALAVDLDGDGDLDVVACAFLPERILRGASRRTYDSLIWLEQVERGRFVRHPLERSDLGHMAMAVGDFNGDGRTDLAVGNSADKALPGQPWLTIWWGTPAGKDSP